MSNKVILDASALLALIKNEPGADVVETLIGNIVMSSVNVSEVAATLLDSEMPEEECYSVIMPFVDNIIEFDAEQSFRAAALKKVTKQYGLSLGDRACLALALSTGYPVYTADKVWAKVNLDCKGLCCLNVM